MNAFAGIVAFDGAVPDKEVEDVLCRALTALRPGSVTSQRADSALFAVRTSIDINQKRRTFPCFADRDSSMLFVAAARLDNRTELACALGLTPSALADTPDEGLLSRLIESEGDAGVARCVGAFAFALWDSQNRRLTLGRDCLGEKSLFYHQSRGWVAFATTLGALLAVPGVPREIDETALAHFMAFQFDDGARTLYRGIERVPSRSLALVDANGVRRRHYWAPNLDAPPPYRRDEDYVLRARELFDQAVAAATRDTPHAAISTSGGLDSSAIAATVARLGAVNTITCFTMVPPPNTNIDVGPFRYLDERDKVSALGRMYPQLDLRLVDTAALHRFDQDAARFFARGNLPVMGSVVHSWYAHLTDAVAAAGHRVLLVGNYGNYGLTWRGNFALLALLRARAWAEFASELGAAARHSKRSLARTLVGDILVPGSPVPLRRFLYRLRGRDADSVAHYSALNPAFVAEHGLAAEWRRRGFDPWFLGNAWHPKLHRTSRMFDLGQTIRDLGGMTDDINGFESRDPHGDRRLLEFVLAVPEPMFRRNGVPRSFARHVFADRLPPEILNEHRRGAQVPDWFRRLQARRQDIATEIERLEASPLASRLIDISRLKRLMVQWPKDEVVAERHLDDYKFVLTRGVHIGQFIRWVEGGNA